ncbi:MAG: M1 family metallopeptidase [Bacteroidota bacterium]|nr:M1 family metallopeptidase [Bacteroidota bacterium]
MWRKIISCLIALVSGLFGTILYAQNLKNNATSNHGNKFEQLGSILADPSEYRNAAGAPGHKYWQQKADYKINAKLDEENRTLFGEEVITYTNNSPDPLSYLWLQLDENQHDPDAESHFFNEENLGNNPFKKDQTIQAEKLEVLDVENRLKGYGVKIQHVLDKKGNKLPYTINYTMMRVDLPKALRSGESFTFQIKWQYKIPERMKIGGRGGYEYFPEDGNDLFTISQWYPRMCVYSDYQGWNHKQFTGRGEFALVFGDFEVSMEVPADHIIAATGECQNYEEVLSKEEYQQWEKAQDAKSPVQIVSLLSAKAKEKQPNRSETKIWNYKATNVRDFAWGSSRKFTWDAMGIDVEGKKVMCMSYYPKESYALYNKYSTKVVAHTIKTYSKFTIPYPYPVAISVEASSGMEYPMICFNYGRTDKEGNYTEAIKYGMIGVIIHEVGHNFFPMIINSDERQWSWMDEGLNTFVQFLTEQEFDNNYPSRRGPAHKIVDYMKLPKNRLEPIMTNSENIIEFGPNAYAKPATALNILRETVMGRELFDFAFKEYCNRWAFKHPRPSDFFRTMEDASGIDLDWYWRAWFYDIEPVDISLDSAWGLQVTAPNVVPVKMDMSNAIQLERIGRRRNGRPVVREDFKHISQLRNKAEGIEFAVDADTTLRDFYYYYNESTDDYLFRQRNQDSTSEIRVRNRFDKLAPLTDGERSRIDHNFYYQLYLSNKGGCVMPVIIGWEFEDGSNEVDYISAYVWRKNEFNISKAFVKRKKVVKITVDPMKETADINPSNNEWPKASEISRFEVFKAKQIERKTNSPMKRLKNKR